MIRATRSREHRFSTRVVTLLLLVAFVLQSAAQASQGCIARAFSGACCCVEASTKEPLTPSCCAVQHAEESDTSDPRIEAAQACHCESAALPSVPASPKLPDAAAERDQVRALSAPALLPFLCDAVSTRVLDVGVRVSRPPSSTSRHPRAFAHDRGNSCRMSRLQVCLR